MRIGIFSDTYHPAKNGIVVLIDITRRELEAAGHEVFVIAPSDGLMGEKSTDDHVIRIPALKGVVFSEGYASMYFPPTYVRKINALELDVIHLMTFNNVGFLGMYSAKKYDIPLVGQHTTDIAAYIEHYPGVLPIALAYSLVVQVGLKFSVKEIAYMIGGYKPELSPTKWTQKLTSKLITLMYNQCDFIVAVSRKTHVALRDTWHITTSTKIVPTGVDPLKVDTKAVQKFKRLIDVQPDDEIILSAGRLAREKNIDLLIDMMPLLLKKRPRAKLILAGDSEYREVLEEKASQSAAAERIFFTGRYSRQEAGALFSIADVFAFPSLTDTQGLVVHEAANAGLPIVLIDADVTEVMKDGKNGFIAENSPKSFAKAVQATLKDPKRCEQFSAKSKQLAAKFTAKKQTQELIDIYESLV